MQSLPHNPVRQKSAKPAHVQQGVMHGTPATRQIHALAISPSAAAKPRRKKAASSTAGKKKAASGSKKSQRSVTAARSGKAHLVKGSAAAKKRMAQLRAMVGKKKAA